MQLPRRVPWAHIGELEQVCSWIYADEEDLGAKIVAINRLSAWKAVTPLPHALDSALAILAAGVLDASYGDTPTNKSALGLRQTYAAAIIRMVNGLVDPLQSGAYARSIAAIATQLGLPSWLVELRHAATHEDLPSLELLRDACKESLSWLFHNYFHPTLNPAASVSAISLSLRPIAPIFKSYKLLMKTVTRDASLRKQHQGEIDSVMRDIERWIAEAKLSVELSVNPLGWAFVDHSAAAPVDAKEKWVLEIICDALIERGAIVPMSKRKRRAPANPFLPTVASLALWAPLLVRLRSNHSSFPSVFIGRIISVLLDDSMGSNMDMDMNVTKLNPTRDATYCDYLARWVTWAAQTWTDETVDLRREVILQVAPSLIPGHDLGLETKILHELLRAISVGSKDMEDCVELLTSGVATVPIQPWKVRDIVDMEKRLQMVVSKASQTSELHENNSMKNGAMGPGGIPAAGWKMLDERSNWVPCGIGVY